MRQQILQAKMDIDATTQLGEARIIEGNTTLLQNVLIEINKDQCNKHNEHGEATHETRNANHCQHDH